MSSRAQDLITGYVRAKDHNRPYAMSKVFTRDARLEMIVHTGTIAFPALTDGNDAIADVLARRFAQSYENVHTFCVATPPEGDARHDMRHYGCRWLVVMSEKESRAPRVGCGRYDWTFRPGAALLVGKLTITIDQMHTLPADRLGALMDWVAPLPYPWCPVAALSVGVPAIDELQSVMGYLA
jgi:hypothetical protein